MTELAGMELDRAVQLYAVRSGHDPIVEYAVPPHGVDEGVRGRWRVVRCDAERGVITVTFFPLLKGSEPEDGKCEI